MSSDPLAARAARELQRRVTRAPRVALVLGSGLGGLAEAVDDAVIVPTGEIEEYPASTVHGHSGRLVFGRLEGVPIVVLQGRIHLYEGYPLQRVTFPIRLLHELGAEKLLLTNAAGGINTAFRPGTLMFISDHINMAGVSPDSTMQGGGAASRIHPWNGRGSPYDPVWLRQAEHMAAELRVRAHRGTYLFTRGPTYETKAEIAAYRRLGADAVGMSTVPEALQAAALGMDVLGISTITNPAAGLSKDPLSHDEVLDVGKRVRVDLERLVRGVLRGK